MEILEESLREYQQRRDNPQLRNAGIPVFSVRGFRIPNPIPLYWDPLPLEAACRNGDVSIVRAGLDAGADLTATDADGKTLLHIAAYHGKSEVCQLLLDFDAVVDARDDHGFTALVYASKKGHSEACDSLLDMGADVNATTNDGGTALIEAAKYGHWEVCVWLLAAGADVHACNSEGWTALLCASKHGHLMVARLLLNYGAVVDARNSADWTALHFACDGGHLEFARLLLDKGAAVEIRVNVDNPVAENGYRALHFATDRGHLEIVQELVGRGADMFAKDTVGITPFDLANVRNQTAVVNYLLRLYATAVYERDGDVSMHSILRRATYKYFPRKNRGIPGLVGRLTLVGLPLGRLKTDHMRTLFQLFRSFDSNLIRIEDDNGGLPLHTACQFRAPVEIVTLLAEQEELALRVLGSAGATPLHIACRFNAQDDEVIRFLVERAPRMLHARDNNGFLPVHAACQGGASVRSIRRLVERGGDWTVSDRNNQSGDLTLHCLLSGSSPTVEAVEYLLRRSPETTSATNGAGVLPLWLACGASAPEDVVYVLLRKYPDALQDSMAVVVENDGLGT